MNNHSCFNATPPANRAGPIERAGFTEVPVMGMQTICTSTSVRPIAHTYRFYPLAARNAIEWEGGSRLLLFLAATAALVALPLELKLATAFIILLRYVLVYAFSFGFHFCWR